MRPVFDRLIYTFDGPDDTSFLEILGDETGAFFRVCVDDGSEMCEIDLSRDDMLRLAVTILTGVTENGIKGDRREIFDLG